MKHLCVLNLFLFLLLFIKHAILLEDCAWTVVINRYDMLGSSRHVFIMQNEVRKVAEVFEELGDSAIDPSDKNARYFGFPYFLKINLTCHEQNSERTIRTAHYTGLTPVVTVTFQEPIHSVRQKREQLQITMEAAPSRIGGKCDSEEVCLMCWFTPMPMMNGSVRMDVLVKSDGFGVLVEDKRFSININGFAKVDKEKADVVYTIGTQLTDLKAFLSVKEVSRPLWATYNQAPVVIIGQVPGSKIILLSDTLFDDFTPIEVAIDSCWIGSLSCPQKNFSSSIMDTIATESTLFIRQNQLVYYFTGNYSALHMKTSGSVLWTRILNNMCVKQLNPVHFSVNDTEFVIALGGGWQEGEFFLISVKDGVVKVSGSVKSRNGTVCKSLHFKKCAILWIVFLTSGNRFILLVKDSTTRGRYYIVSYFQGQFEPKYRLPEFIPKGSDKGFVMMLGTEQYTDRRLIPRGLALNPFSMTLYVWGNVVLQSHDMVNYIYLSSFPSTSSIKYFVLSYQGQYACVTDKEEIWVSMEGSSFLIQVYPSEPWNLFRDLQIIRKSTEYGQKEGMISVFYDPDGLKQLLYLEDQNGNARVIKRKVPLHHILTYRQLINAPYHQMTYEGKEYIHFTHRCPFATERIIDQPLPQGYTRMERYSTKPPDVMDPTKFHDPKSLAVYQGLIFQLLWLHSAYNRPYADPVHDPTWRWWKNKEQDAEYYFYVAGNRNSSGGIYVNMENYVKEYNLMPESDLPSQIYLDKKDAYTFLVYLNIRTAKQSMGETEENSLDSVWITVVLSHPKYFIAKLERQELISRGSVLYEVKITDTGLFPNQDLSGKNLLKGSVILKVAHASMNCYRYTEHGPQLRGNQMIGINIGCPPGKRLAFDITGTLQYTTRKNKRYFDCINPDPEMPCFFFSDMFYPSFLIQDMVTGHSGPFEGSYVFKVIGGGPFSQKEIRYFSNEEILRYNSVYGSKTESLIWLREDYANDQTDEEGFHVLSGANYGIMFVCQRNSACYDITPRDLAAPDYFFVVKVSNRDVDQTTYCDYALEFIIHVHGLRISPSRAIFLMKASLFSLIGLVLGYIFICIVGPSIRNFIHSMYKKIEETMVVRAGSSISFSSTISSQSSLSNLHSGSDHSSQSSPASLHKEKE